MKRVFWMLGFIFVLGLIGLFGSRMVLHRGHGDSAHSDKEKAIYYCPMHPSYTSPRPGDCPICNMKLVKRESPVAAARGSRTTGLSPVAEAPAASEEICVMHNCPMLHDGKPCPMLVIAAPGEKVTCPVCGTHVTEEEAAPEAASTSGYAAVLITPKKQQMIGIKTAAAQKRKMVKTIRTVGRVAYDAELYQAQAEYLQAVEGLRKASQTVNPQLREQAQQLVEGTRIRLRLLGLSDLLIQEMESWKGPDQALLLADAKKRIWVYAVVYEQDLPWVQVGQAAAVEVPSVPGKVFSGRIQAIDSVLDAKSRSARVRFTISDPDGILKPEMFLNVFLVVELGEVLGVAEDAVFDTGLRKIIFVDKGRGLFEPRQVTVGAKADGFYEVKIGISEGESVVVNGNFLVDSESRLKAALESMAPSTGSGQATEGEHRHGP